MADRRPEEVEPVVRMQQVVMEEEDSLSARAYPSASDIPE